MSVSSRRSPGALRAFVPAVASMLAIGTAAPRAQAQEAHVVAVHGDVQGPNGSALAEGTTVGPQQRVVTRDGGSADLELPGGLHVRLGERSNLMLFASPTPPAAGTPASHDSTLARGRARLDVDAGNGHLSFATPSALLTLDAGDEAEVRVDAGRATRVVVTHGSVRVRGAARDIMVHAGSAARVDPGRPPLPVPLPAPPAWVAPFPERVFTSGAPVDLHATFAPPRPHPPIAARWNTQLAHDAAFHDLVIDETHPASHLTFDLHALAPGTYFARVRGADADGLSGPPSSSARIVVAAPRIVPGGHGHRATIEVPRDFFCGLDGGPLAPGGAQFSLAPGRAHVLRCANDARGTGAREITVSAADSGPLVHEVHLDPNAFDPSGGIRVLVLRLSDGAGVPFSYANVRIDASPGASVEPLREGDQRGVYTSTVRWSRGTQGVRLHFVVNDADTFDYTLGAVN